MAVVVPDTATIIALSGAAGAILGKLLDGYITRLGQKGTIDVEYGKLSRDLSRDLQEVRGLFAGQQLKIATLEDQVADLKREKDGANNSLANCEDSRVKLTEENGNLRLRLQEADWDYESAMYVLAGQVVAAQAGGYGDSNLEQAIATITRAEKRKHNEP